jgi:hypothetical protein
MTRLLKPNRENAPPKPNISNSGERNGDVLRSLRSCQESELRGYVTVVIGTR